MNAPVVFTWNGEAMIPVGHYMRMADKVFVVGMNYRLVEHKVRSSASHNHFFAAVEEAWKNLPEEYADRYPSAEHLRKWALCKAGFADERSIVCASKAEAQRVAAFIKPMDDFAVVSVNGSTVKVWTAQSQSVRAMGKDEFQRSKDAVLDILASMVGVTPAELQKAGEAA